MVRGLIFGVIWGGIVTALFLAVISLMVPLPEPVGQVKSPAPVISTLEPLPSEEPTPAPLLSSPTIEDAPRMAETTSAIVPTTGAPESDLKAVSDANETAPAISVADQPSVNAVTADPPKAPAVESKPALNIETVQIVPDQDVTADSSALAADDADAMDQVSKTFAANPPLKEDESIIKDRLPRIATISEQSGDQADLQAVNAADDRPMMAIVLIDTGEFNIGPEALASFPYPITFAIDPLREDAVEAAKAYQDKGYELLLTADLPENGDGELARLALGPTLESIPGAVGLLEGAQTGLQGNMDLAEGVLDVIAASDYGLVLRSKGLNATLQQAQGRGLPVDVVFRDFDGSGQNAAVIRRFLDQAAFKARQEGAVIMVGRLRPATISALLLWGLQDRARTVRLVPISAVLAQ